MWYFDPRINPGTVISKDPSRQDLLSNEDDSSGLGGDQTDVLSLRRKAGESRCAELVWGRRHSSPESKGR